MNLTQEDWESKEADAGALVLAVGTGAVVGAVGGGTFTGASAILAAATLVAATLVAVAAVAGVDTKPMRFPGACLHYWRRVRE